MTKVKEYYLNFGTERKYTVGATREEAHKNLGPIYRTCSTPEQLVEIGVARQPESDGLADFLKKPWCGS